MTDLDELMSKDPLSLSDQDIDEIITYQRKARAQREGGVKPKKGASDAPKAKLDFAALGLIKKAEPMIRRKI